MLLALDLGTKTGWATYDGNIIVSGMQNFKNDRFSGGGMRFLKFQKWLSAMTTPTQVVYEEVRSHVSTDSAHVYGGFLASLASFCEDRLIPYQSVPVGTIKRHWAGKGNASKKEMIAQGHKKGFDTNDDNEMDALALLDYWINHGTFQL